MWTGRISINQLEVNKEFKVVDIRRIKTSYGTAVVLTLEGVGQVFLPKRLITMFEKKTDNELKDILRSNLVMVYRGEREYGRFKTAIIEFS